jgi:hypothetical protein
MSESTTAIPIVRESTAAILRVHLAQPEPAVVQATLAGSAFCITTDRYLLTAHHVLNNGQQRDPNDRFYAFIVPQNGDLAYHFPVISFPIERQDIDIAALEVGPCPTAGVHIPTLPISLFQQADGNRVITVGFPSPEIAQISIDPQLNYQGGQFFLKSHANEGIVSAQYILAGGRVYELNVGWHHGESGGPIVALTDPPAAFALMQNYRNINSPHGIVAGPHRGCGLSVIEQELISLGATIV